MAPLFMVSPNQINFFVPKGTAAGRALALVRRDGEISMLTDFDVDPVAPALFTIGSTSDAAAVVQRVKADGSQSFEVSRLTDPGPETDQVYLVLFGTGIRANSGVPGVTAHIGIFSRLRSWPLGPQGGQDGLDQVNLLIPRAIAGHGPMDVSLTVDGYESNRVVISAR